MLNYTKVPVPYMAAAMQRYVEYGVLPGGFLTALLENDLLGTVARADADNVDNIKEWVNFLFCEIPAECWGSPERVEKWVKSHQTAKV